MIRLLLAVLPILAQANDGINVPFSAFVAVGTILCSTIGYLFRAQMVSQEKRVTEMAKANERIAEEVAAQWRAMDRANRLNAMRMISNTTATADMKNEASLILKDIDYDENEHKQRVKQQ